MIDPSPAIVLPLIFFRPVPFVFKNKESDFMSVKKKARLFWRIFPTTSKGPAPRPRRRL
jgi:hypothetical protein